MFKVCARNYHRYTRLILALGIVREPTVWRFMTSKYFCTHDIGRATIAPTNLTQSLLGAKSFGGNHSTTSIWRFHQNKLYDRIYSPLLCWRYQSVLGSVSVMKRVQGVHPWVCMFVCAGNAKATPAHGQARRRPARVISPRREYNCRLNNRILSTKTYHGVRRRHAISPEFSGSLLGSIAILSL